MSNEFLVSHGEKLALALVVGLSGWLAYGSINNDAVNPGTPENVVVSNIDQIARARGVQLPPELKTPPNYVSAFNARLDRDLPSSPAMAWLTGQPDVGPNNPGDAPIYIYELITPKVAAKDLVGTVELTCTMPDISHSEGRMVDLPSKVWKARDSENRAERVGLLVEYSIGNQNSFKPLNTAEIKDGFVRGKDDLREAITLRFNAETAWETYHFRVRLLARATAYPLGKSGGETSPQTVVVHLGRWSGPDPVWLDLDPKIRRGELAEQFAKPLDKVPAGVELKPGEACFASKETLFSLSVTSATRFTYEKSFTDPENEENLGAVVQITKLLPALPVQPGQGPGQPKWLREPVTFKVKKGQPVGGNAVVIDPRLTGIKIPVDLSTPFMLNEIKKDITRILYYQIKAKPRAGGNGGQRDLEVVAKELKTEAAEFINPNTKQTRIFTKMIRISKQVGMVITPDFPDLVYDEEMEFRKNPAEFKQRELVPPPPKVHEPEEVGGPLMEQRKRTGDASFQTDTKYLETPDGRVYFWDPLIRRMRDFVIPGSEAEAAKRRAQLNPSAPKPTPH